MATAERLSEQMVQRAIRLQRAARSLRQGDSCFSISESTMFFSTSRKRFSAPK